MEQGGRKRLLQQAALVGALFGELREGELTEYIDSGRMPGSEPPVKEPPPGPLVEAALDRILANGGLLIVDPNPQTQ